MSNEASKLANDLTDAQSVGSGVIVTVVASIVAIFGLVIFADLAAWVALVSFLGMVVLMVLTDVYIKNALPGVDAPGVDTDVETAD